MELPDPVDPHAFDWWRRERLRVSLGQSCVDEHLSVAFARQIAIDDLGPALLANPGGQLVHRERLVAAQFVYRPFVAVACEHGRCCSGVVGPRGGADPAVVRAADESPLTFR